MTTKNRVTRRDFLAKTAGAGASFTIMKPSLVFGSRANSRIEVGMIGLGGRGWLISTMLKEHEGFELVAVCDYFRETVDVQGEKLGIPPERRFDTLSGYQPLVDNSPDAVFFETPSYAFPNHVSCGVDAGRHIYMAKPVACDVHGCLRIQHAADKAKANGKVFLVDFQKRTDPHIIEIVKRVNRGDIGKVGLIITSSGSESFDDPPFTENIESRLRNNIWVNDTALGGGYLGNYDVHAVDVGLWFAGEPPVSAMGSSRLVRDNPHGDSHDVYSITYQFGNGLILNHHSEHFRDTQLMLDCYVHGTRGMAETRYWGESLISSENNPYPGGDTAENLYQDGIVRNLNYFHKCVTEGDYSNPTVESSINASMMCILGIEAAERNGLLTWEDMIKENRLREVDLSGLRT